MWLAASGKSSAQICDTTGYRRDWVFNIVKRYNDGGPDALGDQRRNNGGHGRKLTDDQVERVRVRLESGPPDDGGLWTSPKVAAWVNSEFDLDIDFKLAWDYLKRMGFVLRRPRPSHVKSDKKAQEAFKKGGFEVPFSTSWHEEEVSPSQSGPKTKRDSD